MSGSKLRKFFKWTSIILIAAGLTVGIIGLLMGGLNEVDFLFWKQLL